MTDILDDVLLDIEPIELSLGGALVLSESDPKHWYVRKRTTALGGAGLLGAKSYFNPNQPRGRDGRWIEIFGWVKWLENGKWKRGQVTGINDKTGSVTVRESVTGNSSHFEKTVARQKLFQAPKTKASLNLPDPLNKSKNAPGFKKIGGATGSNPAGKYEVVSSDVKSIKNITPEMLDEYDSSLPADEKLIHGTFGNDTATADQIATGIPEDIILLDRKKSKAYIVSGGKVTDMDTGEVVQPVSVLGDVGSEQRKYAIAEIDFLKSPKDNGVQEAWASLNTVAHQPPDVGEQYYVKHAKSHDHAKVEALANSLYELGGVPVPEVTVGQGGNEIASKIIQGDEVLSLSEGLQDPAIKQRIQEDLVFDAWLANWDVAGTGLDNILIVDGVPWRVDSGGSLTYRAQGSPKNKMWNDDVSELQTMVDGTNPWAKQVFGDVSDQTLHNGARRLAAISPQDIRLMVEAHDLDSSMADRLIARRKNILLQLDIDEPYPTAVNTPKAGALPDLPKTAYTPEPELPKPGAPKPATAYPSDLTGKMWVPAAKNFIDGPAPNYEVAKAGHEGYMQAAHPLVIQDILKKNQQGKVQYMSYRGDLWKIDNMEYEGGKMKVSLVHPVTGDTRSFFAQSSYEQFDTLAPNETMELQFKNSWRRWELAASNNPMWNAVDTVGMQSSAKLSTPLPIRSIAVKDDWSNVKVGDWILTGKNGETAYRIASLDKSATGYTTVTGYEAGWPDDVITIEHEPTMRVGVAGSMFNQILGGIDARMTVAKANDKKVGKPSAYGYGQVPPTPADEQMAKLAGQVPQNVPGITQPDLSNLKKGDKVWYKNEEYTVNYTYGGGGYGGEGKKVSFENKYFKDPVLLKDVTLTPTPTIAPTGQNTPGTLAPSNKAGFPDWKPGDLVQWGQQVYVVDSQEQQGAWVNIVNQEWGAKIKAPSGGLVYATPPAVAPATPTPATPGAPNAPEVFNGTKQWNKGDKVTVNGKLYEVGGVSGMDGSMVKIVDEFEAVNYANANSLDVPSPEQLLEIEYAEFVNPDSGMHTSIEATGPSVTKEDIDKIPVGSKVYAVLGYSDDNTQGIFTYLGPSPTMKYGNQVASVFEDAVGKKYQSYDFKKVTPVNVDLPPAKHPQLKNDNNVVLNGVNIGKWWKIDNHGWAQYGVKIYPEYNAKGTMYQMTLDKKSQIGSHIIPLIIAPGITGAQPKSEGFKDLEAAVHHQSMIKVVSTSVETLPIEFTDEPNVLHSETGAAISLGDGAKVTLGMWVISTKDGKGGKVVKVDKTGGYVQVEMMMDDGSTKVKGRHSKTLAAGQEPGGSPPPPSPQWANVKLSDGSHTFPSQKVTTSDGEATVLQINGEAITVMKPDGTKMITQAKSLSAVSPTMQLHTVVQEAIVKTPAVVPALATADTSWKSYPKSKGKIAWAGPDGATIPQDPAALEIWRKYQLGDRKLTKDGFVPHVGMIVRDKADAQWLVVRVAHSSEKNYNGLWVVPADNKNGWAKAKGVQVNSVSVDHAAMLATPDGEPLPKLSSIQLSTMKEPIDLPSGTMVYSWKGSAYVNGRSIETTRYVAALPDGSVIDIGYDGTKHSPADKDMTSKMTKMFAGNYGGDNKLTKFAYIDADSDSMLTIESSVVKSGSGVYAYDVAIPLGTYMHKNEEGALQTYKDQIAQAKIDAGEVSPEPWQSSTDVFIRMPKPADEDYDDTQIITPPIPQAIADPTRLQEPAAISGARSIESALSQLATQKNQNDVGSQVTYAMGDSDYIRDMEIRLQTAVDEQGVEHVELRFKLLEDKIDDLADRLIVPEDIKMGDWDAFTKVNVKDLKAGDYVSTRIGFEGQAKLAESGREPNARVLGPPKKIGVTKNGIDAYEVDIETAGGASGKMLLEDRVGPTIQTFHWDPTKPPPAKDNFQSHVAPAALTNGWQVRNMNNVGYEFASQKDVHVPSGSVKLFVDSQGRKTITNSTDMKGMNNLGATKGAYRMQYMPSSDASVTVQMTHRGADIRQSKVRKGSSIRSSVNGEVLMRVRADDPAALEKISEMMSAVGVPPEAQSQPTPQDLRKMALNKVYKQLNSNYTHRARPDVTGEDDSSAESVIKLIDQKFGTELGRPATIDDIHFRTMSDGRVQTVFSDDVARAIVQHGKFTFAYHHFYSSLTDAEMDNITTGYGSGVMASDERFSRGIVTGGQSSNADVSYDAGDRMFLRLTKETSINSGGLAVLSPAAVAKMTDSYWNDDDDYGRRGGTTNASWYDQWSYGGRNEILIKKILDHETVGFYVASTENRRQQMLAVLKKKGVTHIGGRPVEEIIVVAGQKTAADLGEIGMNPVGSVEVPINDPTKTVSPATAPALVSA